MNRSNSFDPVYKTVDAVQSAARLADMPPLSRHSDFTPPRGRSQEG